MKTIDKYLKDLDQDEILDFIFGLDPIEKTKFYKDLKAIDFEKLKLAFDVDKLSKLNRVNLEDDNIMPHPFVIKSKIADEAIETSGLALVSQGKAASLLMAGGMGSRLGFDGPKGAFIVDENKSVFEIHVDKLMKIHSKTGFYPLLLIMCSSLNLDASRNYFESKNYFFYPKDRILFFTQGNLPACDLNYKFLFESKNKLKLVPDGNGGVFTALYNSGILERLNQEGVKWLQVSGIDNILLDILDPIFLAFAENSGVSVASKSVERVNLNEKVGVFVMKNSKPSVIEYSELEGFDLQNRKDNGQFYLSEANIACHLFKISDETFKKCQSLPLHTAKKKINYYNDGKINVPTEINAIKFEQFIFDAFSNYDKMAIMRVDRESEFAPLKNKEGTDSIATAKAAYRKYLKKRLI